MDYIIEDKGAGVKNISITLSAEYLDNFLDQAAKRLSKKQPLPGWRPGQAPRKIVEQKFGAMALLEEAADEIVKKSYYDLLQKEKLAVVGQPKIEIKKMVPGDVFEYTAVIALLPTVVVGEVNNLQTKPEEAKVEDKEIAEVLADVRKMRAEEKISLDPINLGDKAIIDFTVKVQGIVIEGGQGRDYPLVVGDKVFIPGFEEQLVGKKTGDKLNFKLNFPSDYKVDLAGKEADFEVEIKSIYQRILPPVDDSLAAKLGDYKNLDDLKKQVKNNILLDKQQKADQNFEVKLLEELMNISTFGEIPEILVDNELHRMLHELEDKIEAQGLKLSEYLQSIGKDQTALKQDWRPAAIKRVKTALLAKQLATDNQIAATKEEIDQELEALQQNYQQQPQILANLGSDDFRDYLFHTLTNRKVINYLKGIIRQKK